MVKGTADAEQEDDPDPEGSGSPVRTLADLARLAGVSAGTVSRALAGKALVNAETRERIRALARQHGFRPNQMASKLRSRRTGVVGAVIPVSHERQHISDPFFLTLLGYVADELTESGFDLMLSRAVPDGTSEWLERVTSSGMVDGVLLMSQGDQFEVIERVSASYLPLVAWGASRDGQRHCVVGTDNLAGGRMAAEHLIAAGASKLVFLGETEGIEVAQRHQGASAAAAQAGIPITHLPISLAAEQMGPQLQAAVADCDIDVDGVVAATDLIAITALRCLHDHKRRIPDDVQVIGFDDVPLAQQTMPPLTTIRQDVGDGAKAMVDRLRQRIAGEITDSLVMPPRLVVRETTRAH